MLGHGGVVDNLLAAGADKDAVDEVRGAGGVRVLCSVFSVVAFGVSGIGG